VIAATNRNIDREAAAGTFRSDLLYRLRSLFLHLPPLRERKEDIRPLSRHFLARLCDRAKVGTKGIADEFFEFLMAYDWPGNVRELQQTLEEVFANAVRHPTLFAYHLPQHIRVCKTLEGMKTEGHRALNASRCAGAMPMAWRDFKTEQERSYLRQLLAFTNGSIKDACQVSGLSRARLYQLINLHGLVPTVAEID
jgi:two-component system NtrC family response regulator